MKQLNYEFNNKPTLNDKIAEAKLKQNNSLNKISLKEKDYYFGINVDKSFSIEMNGKEIGKCGISEMNNPEETYLEWLEFLPEFRGRHLLRETLLSIAEHLNAKHIILEASEEKVDIYTHLGAVKTEYDDFREIQGFKLSVDDLKKNIKHNKIDFNQDDREI